MTPTTAGPNTFQGKPVVNGHEHVEVIHGFALGEGFAGLVTISRHEGRRAMDVRRFYLDEATNTWRPSVKGLRIPPVHIEDIAIALGRFLAREGK